MSKSAMPQKTCKIAILASSTVKSLPANLSTQCATAGIAAEIYLAGYNQYHQEILQSSSQLYTFQPQIIFLFIDTMALLGDTFFSYEQLSLTEQQALLHTKFTELSKLVETLQSHTSAKIVLHNFEVPIHSALGILENKQELSLREFVEQLNTQLRSAYKKSSQVFLFDYNTFLAKLGKNSSFNAKMYYLADIKLDLPQVPLLATAYLSYVKPLCALSKKCLVLDLDNTLWGGIIGEDGLEGILLGPTPEGRPFWELQKYILSLAARGVILAINSKNNPEDVLEVLQKHPHMVLKEQHFAAMRINWNDKASNLKALATELNIGLDSMVFVDDDKLNCDLVRNALPQVKTIELPADPAQYLGILQALDDFNTLQITEEDRNKAQIYAEQRARTALQESVTDIESYLKALQLEVGLQLANPLNIPRIAQLTQKTNQFNLTTRRYTEEEIQTLARDKNYLVFCVSVKDKFGDNGIVGVAIVQKSPDLWTIESFLLSCRVIGRKIENSMLAYIAEQAKIAGAKKVIGLFIPSAKNDLAKSFYHDAGWQLEQNKESRQSFVLTTTAACSYPEFITLTKS